MLMKYEHKIHTKTVYKTPSCIIMQVTCWMSKYHWMLCQKDSFGRNSTEKNIFSNQTYYLDFLSITGLHPKKFFFWFSAKELWQLCRENSRTHGWVGSCPALIAVYGLLSFLPWGCIWPPWSIWFTSLAPCQSPNYRTSW